MNLGGQAVKSMSITSSTVTCKSGDGVSDNFPAGLRVLVVDDDRTCLIILEQMLRKCLYEVKKCNRAEDALFHLRENKNGYDIVISDVHMPDMDGFKLLEHIGLEMDLPVIMMSADDSKNVVMKGVTHGACDYLIKPVRIEALRNIWQHVVRRKKHEWREFEQSGSAEDGGERQQKPPEEADYSSSVNEGSCRNSKRRKEEEDDAEERDDSSSLKKPRVVWSVELHQQFVAAVNQLGIDKAVPKKILELMNVAGLTRENVASHLQKYRLYLRRLSGVSQHQSGLSNSFMGNPEAAFGSISSLNGLDLQALAATGQLPAQSLAALGRSTSKSAISMPLVDQRNLFSFERYEEGQQQLLNNNNSKQMNLLHGIPTNMEAKQLVSLHQSTQSFGGMNMHVGQPQSRPQIMNESNGNQVSRFPSSMGQSMGQPILSNGMVGGVYNQVPQSSSMVDFSMNHNTDLATNSFSLGGNLGVSSLTSKGVLQEEVNLEMKGSRVLVSSYDIFEELHQHKPQDWGLQNVALAFDASRQTNIQGNVGISSSVLVHQGYSSSQKTGGQNRNSYIGQQVDTPLIDHSLRIKAESLSEASYQNTLFPVQFGQEDLMAALLKQQQEGIGQVENEFGFDGYPLDNLPV